MPPGEQLCTAVGGEISLVRTVTNYYNFTRFRILTDKTRHHTAAKPLAEAGKVQQQLYETAVDTIGGLLGSLAAMVELCIRNLGRRILQL